MLAYHTWKDESARIIDTEICIWISNLVPVLPSTCCHRTVENSQSVVKWRAKIKWVIFSFCFSSIFLVSFNFPRKCLFYLFTNWLGNSLTSMISSFNLTGRLNYVNQMNALHVYTFAYERPTSFLLEIKDEGKMYLNLKNRFVPGKRHVFVAIRTLFIFRTLLAMEIISFRCTGAKFVWF